MQARLAVEIKSGINSPHTTIVSNNQGDGVRSDNSSITVLQQTLRVADNALWGLSAETGITLNRTEAGTPMGFATTVTGNGHLTDPYLMQGQYEGDTTIGKSFTPQSPRGGLASVTSRVEAATLTVTDNVGHEIDAHTGIAFQDTIINSAIDPGSLLIRGKKGKPLIVRLPQDVDFEIRPAADNPSPSNGIAYPLGNFDVTFSNITPGSAVDLILDLSSSSDVPVGFRKFGPTPDNSTPHSYDFTFDSTTGAQLGGKIIGLHFVDGARGDADLTANGMIVDPGAAAFPNNAPMAQSDSLTVPSDQSSRLDVVANDSDPDDDDLFAVNLTQPSHGQASVNMDGSVQYVSQAGYFGPDSFRYQASDLDKISSNSVLVNLLVNAPVDAIDDTAQVIRNVATILQVLTNDTNLDHDPLTISSMTQPTDGTATLNANGTITFTPAADFSGETSFMYSIHDGHGSSDTATVVVTVIAHHSVSITLPAANANTRLRVNATNDHVELVNAATNAVLLDLTADGVTQLTINGGRADNRLTVDFRNGSPLPIDGLFFNGGRQELQDDLVLVGGSFGSVTHTFASRRNGTVTLDGATITYTGLEPITDNLVLLPCGEWSVEAEQRSFQRDGCVRGSNRIADNSQWCR
ncbi:MAG: outer membrane adhesin-like protein [Planctomycetota bacterium]|nr:MAG: outer membrane adhesin-like protein [Planctomycetota bacterium]